MPKTIVAGLDILDLRDPRLLSNLDASEVRARSSNNDR